MDQMHQIKMRITKMLMMQTMIHITIQLLHCPMKFRSQLVKRMKKKFSVSFNCKEQLVKPIKNNNSFSMKIIRFTFIGERAKLYRYDGTNKEVSILKVEIKNMSVCLIEFFFYSSGKNVELVNSKFFIIRAINRIVCYCDVNKFTNWY